MSNVKRETQKRLKAMQELGRIASVMLDGDEALRIITDNAMQYITHPDRKYPYLAGDKYDVHYAPFLHTKKTLLRLERLVDFTCHACLWIRVKGAKGRLTAVVHNGSLSRWYAFGCESIPADKVLSDCLATGRIRVLAPDRVREMMTVVAPVFDSLGDAVGVVEFGARHPAAKKLAPAMN